MKRNLYISFLFFSVLSSCSSHKTTVVTKTKIITGFVFYESDKQPVPGANINVKGSKTKKTISDFDGKFEIETKKGEVLLISFVGMEDREIIIDSINYYEVILKPYTRPKSRQEKRYIKRETRKNGGYYVFPD